MDHKLNVLGRSLLQTNLYTLSHSIAPRLNGYDVGAGGEHGQVELPTAIDQRSLCLVNLLACQGKHRDDGIIQIKQGFDQEKAVGVGVRVKADVLIVGG